jgi:hypothetical protein
MTETAQASGKTLNVSYSIEENMSEDQARELISNNTPEGFSVQNVELESDS